MSTTSESSDAALLDLLCQDGPLGVSELTTATAVTATAVRQRLNRLLGQGLIERRIERAGRGRPSHKYSITQKGLRQTGNNYADLTLALWEEVRSIDDPEIRRGLMKRLADKMADRYSSEVGGGSLRERMEALKEVMEDRGVAFRVDGSGELPVLTALACPYPDLAEQDRAICALERMLFSEVLGESVKLTNCRMDGATCCTFEGN